MVQPLLSAAIRSGWDDALSDVLNAVRLRSFVASRGEFTARWEARIPGPDDLPARNPAKRLEALTGGFYAITGGACWLEAAGCATPLRLIAGDIVVMIRDQGHQLRDDLGSAAPPVVELKPEINAHKGMSASHGGGGAMTTFVAGGFCFEDGESSRLFASLPPYIHLPAGESGTGPWLEETLRFVGRETTHFQPGAQSLLNQLTQILFVQAVRAHVSRMPPDTGNWLSALLDPDIGHVLTQIHDRPQDPWTVASLADTVAMSRSAFAARFTALVSEPPLRYLSHFRLARAATLLGTGRVNVKQAAARVGYESEASFSKAFKKVYGLAPGAWRKEMFPKLETIEHQYATPRQPERHLEAQPCK